MRTSDLQPPGSKPKPVLPWRYIQWLSPRQWHLSLGWGGERVGQVARISPSQYPHANHLLNLLGDPQALPPKEWPKVVFYPKLIKRCENQTSVLGGASVSPSASSAPERWARLITESSQSHKQRQDGYLSCHPIAGCESESPGQAAPCRDHL